MNEFDSIALDVLNNEINRLENSLEDIEDFEADYDDACRDLSVLINIRRQIEVGLILYRLMMSSSELCYHMTI